MSKITIIDADTIIWLSTVNTKDCTEVKTAEVAIKCADGYMRDIQTKTEAEGYIGFLTDSSFRYKIATIKPYKGNRVGQAKPLYFNVIREYLREEYYFESVKNYEADDLCIMAALGYKHEDVTIASPDKDLRQIECKFYDYKKCTFDEVNKKDAEYNLWKQVLTGDSGDNIQGIPGIGAVKAAKLLANMEDYRTGVLSEYLKMYGEYKGITYFAENYQLIKMLEDMNGEPYLPHIKEVKLKSEVDAWLQ